MWCKNCNIETNEEICPVCGTKTSEDLPVEIYWCKDCRIPIIHLSTDANKGACPNCEGKTRYMASDLRPVFPEERLLLAILEGKEASHFMDKSVWAANSRYYIDGKPLSIPAKAFAEANTDQIAEQVSAFSDCIDYASFDHNIAAFISANQHRLAYLKDEAFSFVRKAAERFKEENIVISFSGGKDSTVTADLVTKALSNPSLVHIFGNTTLEFPCTVEYANRYRDTHPLAIFQIAKNDEQVFYDVCDDIGPPARMMRWCCSMFKTGPITRVINSMYRSQQILTFYGIRKSESVSRSKYNRIEDDAESVKIQQQTVASPIFFWKDTYIEELGTLYLLQYCLASQKEEATAWYFFFNEFSMSEFSREDFVDALQKYIKMQADENDYAIRSLNDDFQCIINTYLPRYKTNPGGVSPENNIDCPFGELGLVDVLNKRKKTYKKSIPSSGTINPYVALADVSRLFSVNGCTFLSINLTTIKEQRSQVAHEIHTMIHPLTGTDGSICLFQCDQEIMITLVGYGLRCIMSDWYPIDDDYNLLLDRLDIANMSVDNGKDYYFDMVYMLAREYFLSERPLSYELLPIDFISAAGIDGVDRDAVNQTVEDQLAAPLQQYGDDYVEYDVQYVAKTVDISAALNLMLLEMDIEDDNPFDEEVEAEDNLDEDDLYEGEAEDQGLDEYEFGDIDPEVFKDPTLLVKLLKKQPSE